jgi:hypothetical protein
MERQKDLSKVQEKNDKVKFFKDFQIDINGLGLS